MPLDIQEAIQTLQQELALLKEISEAVPGTPPEFVAQMYTTTHLLFSHPIINAVAVETIGELDQQHTNARALVWGAAVEAKRLASLLGERLVLLHSRLPQEALPDVMLAYASLARRVTLLGERVLVVQLFRRIAESTFVGDAATLTAVNDAVEAAKEFLARAHAWLELDSKGVARDVMAMLHDFRVKIQGVQINAETLLALVESLSLRNAVTRLRLFDQWVFSVLEGQQPPTLNFEIPDAAALRSQLLLPLRVLAARVLEKLAAEVPVAHVLRRMKVHFEHFAREEIVEELMQEGLKQSPRVEDRIQLKMDRFLFDDGLFPITHISAAGGVADTLVSEAVSKIGVARENAIPPVLIELKQALSFDAASPVGEAAVRSKVKEGRLQARTYADHIATNVNWSRPRVHVIVFYNGPQRYHVDVEDVLLVYLGEKRPSHGSAVLGLGAH